MSKKNNNIKSEKNQYFKQLTRDDRAKIELMLSMKDENGNRLYNQSDIARELHVHRSTISRELKRRYTKINPITNKQKTLPYNVEDAQKDKNFKRGLSNAKYIVEEYPKLKKYIEDKILINGWAPDVIAGRIEKEKLYLQKGFTSISASTIYRAIHLGLLKVKKSDTRRMEKFHSKGKDDLNDLHDVPENKKAYSIELRPDDINNRLFIGHWELDTVIGTKEGKHRCLMTLTERKSKFEIIIVLESKTKEEVVLKFKKIKKYLKKKINKVMKSLTTDNGSEFAGFLDIIKTTGASLYFCHPYASGEKGTNEKNNGMIRYFIPKGNLIENYTSEEIYKIAKWMNNYPRKSLNYLSPAEVFKKELNDDELYNKIVDMQKKINN